MYPLYDFNLKPGQFCQVWEADEDCIFEWDPFYEMEVKAEGNIMACGNVRRKIELEDKQTNKSVVWVRRHRRSWPLRYADQILYGRSG